MHWKKCGLPDEESFDKASPNSRPDLLENWVPNGVIVNQHYYKKVLETCEKGSEGGQKKKASAVGNYFLLYQENVPNHTQLSQ